MNVVSRSHAEWSALRRMQVLGDAGEAVRRALADHAVSCAECRQEEELLMLVDEMMRILPVGDLMNYTIARAGGRQVGLVCTASGVRRVRINEPGTVGVEPR